MWIEVAAVVVVGFLIFKFIFKPIFKIVAFVALALLALWMFGGF